MASVVRYALRALTICASLPAGALAQSGQGPSDNSLNISILSIAGTPLAYSTVAVVESGIERFSNERGEFVLAGLPAGTYHVRARQLGFNAKDTTVHLTGAPKSVSIQLRLTPIPFLLANVIVTAVGKCPAPTDLNDPANATLGVIFGEVSKNADRLRLLQERYPFTYTLRREFTSSSSYTGPNRSTRDTVRYESGARWNYSPGEVVQRDESAAGEFVMRLPQLVDLADTAFQATHCFYYRGTERKEAGLQHRVDFIPLSEFDFPDVEGSVFIDSRSYILTTAVFRLTKGGTMKPPILDIEVVTAYQEIYPNIVIFREIVGTQPPPGARGRTSLTAYRQRQSLLSHAFLRGKPGDAIELVKADTAARVAAIRDSIAATLGSVTGTIRNVARQTVSGALVSIAGPAIRAVTDSAGQFAVRELVPDEYELTVSAEGYETIRVIVDVIAGKTITLTLVLFPLSP